MWAKARDPAKSVTQTREGRDARGAGTGLRIENDEGPGRTLRPGPSLGLFEDDVFEGVGLFARLDHALLDEPGDGGAIDGLVLQQ